MTIKELIEMLSQYDPDDAVWMEDEPVHYTPIVGAYKDEDGDVCLV